jgi:2,4-dienoyl-CoA reductase-like NADH-dependent reductase (Old Yellow Enzyme family)
MANLFESNTLNGMNLPNRLVRSATWEGMCDQAGRPPKKLADYYHRLSLGGVGLIITGYAYVSPEGKQNPGKMGIYADELAEDYRALTGAVHEAGGKIAIQLVHAGGQADSRASGLPPLAPSAVDALQFPSVPAELTRDDIARIIAAFAESARRAKAWGFDGVQLHSAHGYLINQFLSPLTNRREDGYGGDIAQRCRFLLEIFMAVREEVGDAYPVFIKLNGADNLEGGLTIEDGIYAARELGRAGIDAIEVSAGTPASGAKNPARTRINKPEKEAYNLDLAKKIKAVVPCPVMSVGGHRSYEIAARAIAADGMDYVALSRPLIREPDLPRRWQEGDLRPAACISCNACFKPGLEEGGIYCVAEAKLRKKAES